MGNKIEDTLEEIQGLEDSISNIIQCFEDETGLDNLITVAYPDDHTILISLPTNIAICPKCDGVFDKVIGCCS